MCIALFEGVGAQEDESLRGRVSISGTVKDNNYAVIPYASVAAINKGDSSIASGTITDEKGKFELSVPRGNYFIRVSFLSFKDKIIANIPMEKSEVNLGTIVLSPGAINLEEVEVTGERKQMQLRIDKRVYNVGSDLSTRGANAIDILNNVPSVVVDIEGNVSLRGSENVRILIDGKPSGLVGISSTDALRQLQDNMIERIEVITNPSAKYDAEGEAGIINIVLKKGRQKGLHGTFNTSAGYPDNYSGSFNVNYRRNIFNVFANYGLRYRKRPGKGYSLQEFTGDSVYSYERDREHSRGGLSHNFQLGMDLYLNEFNVITLSGLYRYSDEDNEAQLIYRDFNADDILTGIVTRTDNETELENNTEATLSYRKTFSQKGREWITDLKYMESDELELSDLEETSNQATELPIIQRSSNTEDESNLIFQSDYVHPLGKGRKFETGWKSTYRIISNEYTVEEQDSSSAWFVLPDYDNHFVYSELIHAGYAITSFKFRKISWQAGLRAEYSDIATELKKTRGKNRNTYISFFPSVHLSYELDTGNTLQVSYSRRLSRPRFRHLLPFYSFSDSRNFFKGNPDLEPEFTSSFDLSHLKYLKNGSVLTGLYYRYRTGVIQRIIQVDSAGQVSFFPINLSTQNAFGLEFSLNLDIRDWWRITGNVDLFRQMTSGEYDGESLESDSYSMRTRGSSIMKIKKRVDAQISFDYRAPSETTQGRRKSMYMVDLGMSMDVFKDNATLTLSIRDLFNTRKMRLITNTSDYNSELEFQWRSRQFLINFTYRLNQNKKNGKRGEGGFEEMDGMEF